MQPLEPRPPVLPGQLDSSLLDDLPMAATAVDRQGKVIYANAAATALFAQPPEQLSGADLVQAVFEEAEQGSAQEVLNQALGGRAWSGDLSMMTATEGASLAHISCTPLRRDGQVAGALVIAQPVGPSPTGGGHDSSLGGRLTRLARVAAELVMADDIETVTKIVINHAGDAAGATIASLSLLVDPDTLVLQGLRGGLEGAASRWATFPLAARTPVGDAVRTGRQVLLVGKDQIRETYPDLESAAPGERTMICLPLKILARSIGAVSLSFPGLRHLDSAELEFLGILADVCAQALDRVHALDEAADHARKLTFLADASAELSSSLDYQTTLTKVARLAVPHFADWCAIALAEDGDLRTLAVAHVDPQKVALAEELERSYPPGRDADQGSYHVFRTGVSELIPEISDEMLVAGTEDDEHLGLARELNLRSALVVPLIARGKVLGVITWVSGDQGRRFGRADLTFAEDLARRAGSAIDNAQLHSETLQAAVRLQHAVLPDRLPEVPGWTVAAHYSPGGRTQVGGDFYDVVPLEDATMAVFVGDVMGRGVVAAAAMATMRAAVRAYLAVDPDPEVVMHNLDVMFSRYDISQLVTLVCILVDPVRDELRVANAGHPPPVIHRRGGDIEQLASPGEGPLGVPGIDRTSVVVPFLEGDTLIAFTDGLIERRTEDIDAGQRRLVEACGGLVGPDLSAALEELVDCVRDHTRNDDLAAVVARRTLPA
jgi:GAF domain-containing protein